MRVPTGVLPYAEYPCIQVCAEGNHVKGRQRSQRGHTCPPHRNHKPFIAHSHRANDRTGQKTGMECHDMTGQDSRQDRGQDMGQGTEDRGPDRGQRTGDKRLKTEN